MSGDSGLDAGRPAAPLVVHTMFNLPFSCARRDASGPAWIAARIDLYMRYTVRSLERQTERDFAVWLDCRPGSEEEIAPHLPALAAAGVTATFDRGRQLLAELFHVGDALLVTRIDSDDMYGPDAIQIIRALHGGGRASQFFGGYVYEVASARLFRVMPRSPPFYTLRFRRGEIASAGDIAAMTRLGNGRQGHNVVRELFHPQCLPDGRFCILRHAHNNSSGSDGRPIDGQRALEEVRSRFELPFAAPAGLGDRPG